MSLRFRWYTRRVATCIGSFGRAVCNPTTHDRLTSEATFSHDRSADLQRAQRMSTLHAATTSPCEAGVCSEITRFFLDRLAHIDPYRLSICITPSVAYTTQLHIDFVCTFSAQLTAKPLGVGHESHDCERECAERRASFAARHAPLRPCKLTRSSDDAPHCKATRSCG